MILKRADTAIFFALQNDHLMKRSESHKQFWYWATMGYPFQGLDGDGNELAEAALVSAAFCCPFISLIYLCSLCYVVLRCATLCLWYDWYELCPVDMCRSCCKPQLLWIPAQAFGLFVEHSCSILFFLLFVCLTSLHFGILSLFVFISLGQAVFPRPFAILEGVWWFSSRSGIGNGNNPEQSKMFKADFCLSTGS